MKPKFRLRLKDNISNTEADNCKQKVLKLHPDTKAKEKVVKALRVAKEEELSSTTKYCQDKKYVAIQQSQLDYFRLLKMPEQTISN